MSISLVPTHDAVPAAEATPPPTNLHCFLCTQNIETENRALQLTCSHIFHEKCLAAIQRHGNPLHCLICENTVHFDTQKIEKIRVKGLGKKRNSSPYSESEAKDASLPTSEKKK